MTGTCPVCGSAFESHIRGRPKAYCSGVCTERARLRRRQAAQLLEGADAVEESIGQPGMGSESYLRDRVAGLRAEAAELLASIGETIP